MTQTPKILDVYGRVSRVGDERQRSTTGQVEDCVSRVEELGAAVGEVHVDDGRSAWNPRVRRPGWDRLMERLEAGKTGGVIVWDLARFSRRPKEGERLIDAAENGLLILDSENEYDLTTPNGKKAFRDHLAGAAYESDRLSRRVKRGKRIKARRGEANTSTRPFAFEMDGGVRESEAVILRELIARLLAGESQDAMIIDLNRRGITTSYGKPWTRAGLRQVLTRPRNCGLVVHLGVAVSHLPGAPIIDEETHDHVMALYTARRRGRPISETYLCSGTVECGLCGHRLSGRPRKNMRPYDDGEVRRGYWCQRRAHDGGCGRISIDQRDLDRHVKELTLAIHADPRHAATVEAAAVAVSERRAELDREIAELEHTAEELAGRLGRGEIKLARHDAAAKPLDRRLAELYAALGELAAEPAATVAPEVVAASRAVWERRWGVATTAERRALVRQALRGRRLVVAPADPHNKTDVAFRVTVEE